MPIDITAAGGVSTDTHPGASPDQPGTAPEDRRFRPDVEGLRALAIVLVVLYHSGLKVLGGGYVGVDVFFVISGFVITGLLLREQVAGGPSILGFYGRRARRILPAATATIVVTMALAYTVLGVISGNQTAIDGRWAALFLANFRFASIGTNYLTAQAPPSPLQNFWSLSVEEQFYFVYPTLFLIVCALRTRVTLRIRLALGLTLVVLVSFAWSVIQTASDPTVAYFSPFTRAWELALGALVAVGTRWLLRIPRAIGSVMTWAGLAAIGWAACAFGATTAYPGAPVAIPVVGAALVIAGGTAQPHWGTESLLGLAPCRWLGRLSYSLYLWHWPILILAAESANRTSLSFTDNLPWLAVAIIVSMLSYQIIEKPVRHAPLAFAGRWGSVGLGIVLVAATVGVATVQLTVHSGTTAAARVGPAPAESHNSVTAVMAAIRSAPDIRVLPNGLAASLADVNLDWGGPPGDCWPTVGQTSIPPCVFGDVHGNKTVVLYGDSHAGMWFAAIDYVAFLAHWRLVYLGKGYCGAALLPYQNPPGWGRAGGEYSACDQWHTFAVNRINRIRPDLVIVTQEVRPKPDGQAYTAEQWKDGLKALFRQFRLPGTRIDVLGNIPILPWDGPDCLARHETDVQACSHRYPTDEKATNLAERTAAESAHAHYIDTTPWFCSITCTAVVGRYNVYFDQDHVTASYSGFLLPVLTAALRLQTVRG